MTDKKLVVGAALPPLIVIAYSLLFKVDPITTLLHLSPYFTLSFFLAYLASNAVASVRDALLAKVPYSVAFKARLLGNAVGLVIPGALGGDLTRAVVYSKSVKLKLDEAFAISTVSAFYDVVIGSLMYLLLLIVQPKPLDVIFTLVALANILFWLTVIGYLAGTAGGKKNRLERLIFEKLRNYPEIERAYFRAKEMIKTKNSPLRVVYFSFLTVAEFAIQAMPLVYLFEYNYLVALLVNQLYFVSLLVLIPAGSVSSEFALSTVLPPNLAISLRTLELVAFALGFVFIKEINLKHIQEELRRYGEVFKRAQPRTGG